MTKFKTIKNGNDIDIPFINDDVLISEKLHSLSDGDLIIADTAEDHSAGKTIELKNVGECKILSGLHTIPLRPKQKCEIGFLGYYLNSNNYKQQIYPLIQGIKVYSISKSSLLHTYISTPSTEEQHKIANLLTKLDEYISVQNKIIKKYESLMNPIIEKLMREFKCNQYRLKDISQIKKGEQIGNTLLSSGGAYPMLNGGISFSGNYTHFNRESNTIAISEGGNSCGYVSFIDKEFWAGGHCYTIHPKRKDPVFNRCLFYVLKKQENKIMTLRVGSGLPNIQKRDLENLLINLPESSCISRFNTILGAIEEKIKIEKVIFSKLVLLKRYLLANLFI